MTLIDEAPRRMIRGDYQGVVPLTLDDVFVFDTNIFVGAGAGSGKTTVLIQRMVALIRMGVPIQEIVAITFTRKAAGEMRGRFFKELTESGNRLDAACTAAEDAAVRDALRREAQHVRAALARVEDVFIDTIHAFCTRLLRERPFLAGLTPDFSMIQDRDERILRRSFWNVYVKNIFTSHPEWQDRLVHLGIEASVLQGYFGDRCRYDSLNGPDVQVEEPDLSEAIAMTLAYLHRIRDAMPLESPRDGISEEVERADRFERVHGFTTNADRASFLRGLDHLVYDDGRLKDGAVRVTRWSRKKSDPSRVVADALKSGADDSELPSISEFVVSVVRPALVRWRTYVYGEIEHVIRAAVRDYAVFRKAEGKLTFDDLLRICSETLRDSSSARDWFGERYTHLLVDEFQDTDPLQAEVLFYLSSQNRKETNWTRCEPRPGSLFIVGDDKQSIYRFRHADLRIYEKCRQLIQASGGIDLRLRTNFRSDRAVCDFLNRALKPHFDVDGEPYQAKYEELISVQTDEAASPAIIQLPVDTIKGHSPVKIAAVDAEHVAWTIQQLTNNASTGPDHIHSMSGQLGLTSFHGAFASDVSYGDCMILVRYAKRLTRYAEALERAGIPYTMAGGKALHRARVLADLMNLIDAAYDLNDAIALISYLRGPFCGISDTALHHYREAGGTFSGHLSVPEALSGDIRSAFEDAFCTLQRAREWLTSVPMSQALELLCAERGILASCSLQGDGSAQSGALFRTLALVRAWEADGLGWTDVRDELHRLLDGEVEADAMTLEVGSPNAVRLLNVHQAKGLEARVVFLADPAGHAGVRETESHVDRGTEVPILFLPIRVKSTFSSRVLAEPEGWPEARSSEDRFSAGENTRLLYVAATRAKEMLFVSRYAGKETGVWTSLHDILDSGRHPVLKPGKLCSEKGSRSLAFEDLEAMETKNRDNLRRLSKLSYSKTRATDAADHDLEMDSDTDEWMGGQHRGRGYGRAVHRLFEYAVSERSRQETPEEDRLVAQRFLDEEQSENEAPLSDVLEDALRGLWAFRESRLWRDILRAETVLTEVPFGRHRDTGDGEGVLTGVIDLVYLVGGVWNIIDYKTDRSTERSLVERYGPQIAAYADSWHYLLQETIGEKGIWWIPKACWIPIA